MQMTRTLAVLTPQSGSFLAGAVAAVPSGGAGTPSVKRMNLTRRGAGGKRWTRPTRVDVVPRCR